MNQPEGLTKVEMIALTAEKNTAIQIIRALAPMTPIIGGVIGGIDKLYEFWIKDIESKNAAVYAQNVKQILDKIESAGEDKEWEALIKHSFIKSLRCSKAGQIRKIVDILNGKCTGNIESFNDAEDLINIVSELSENEARCLFETYNILKNTGKKAISGEDIKNIPEDQSEYLLTRLAGKALLKIDTAFQPISGGGKTKFSSTKVGKIIFSTLSWFEDN